MKRIAALVAMVMLAGACSGSDGQEQVGTEPGDSSPPTSAIAASSSVPTSDATADAWIDPTAVWLTEADVPEPWDLSGESQFEGYDLGANQSDCDAYWQLERLVSHDVASRLWFQPGANLDHDVYDTGPEAAAELLDTVRVMGNSCPVVNWNEGGTLSITNLESTSAGVEVIDMVSDTGEKHRVAYATRANLVSRLSYIHFGTEPGQAPPAHAEGEFERLVAAMVARLDAAAPGREPVPTTTSAPTSTSSPTNPPTVRPPSSVASTTLPPLPTLSPATTTTLEDNPLRAALLSADELPAGLSVARSDQHSPGDPDDQRIDGCPASESIVDLDTWFVLNQDLAGDSGITQVQQIVGRAPSAADAQAAVADFALIAQCDLSVDEEFQPDDVTGGSITGLAEGTAATLAFSEPTDGVHALLIAYQVGDVVGVLVVADLDQAPTVEQYRPMIDAAVARAAKLR
ncbi:MAG: hypothetical protein ACR2QE_02185 [Acidimicrobiales bacterium]